MLHTDIPTRSEIQALAAVTDDVCVSIYTPTEDDVADPEQSRIAFRNQARDALTHVSGPADNELEQAFDDLLEDDDFWRFQSRTLVVLATPTRLRTFRLPNRLGAAVAVGDRFLIKPLLRAITFPQTAFILALSEGAVRLIEMTADSAAHEVRVPGLPTSAADYANKASLSDRAPKRRIQGGEGRKLRVRQYARAIDQELRAVLAGRDVPMILAAAEPTDSLFRAENSYHALLDESISGNPETLTDDELGTRAREILDRHYESEIRDFAALFDARRSESRALTDTADIARAATFGQIDTVLVDVDAAIPGTLAPEDGAITREADPGTETPGILDEIARRVLLHGGKVFAVRADDMPETTTAAAILRYAA
ncbi:hypothetical protein DFR70_1011057 [Nocardia tenerifensis]|uniref:Peptide subunit release factor 1 (ERF1) n=1 Tax=Nocardia tenerifensis TaxID=228006 RepID=A0A318KHH7_9NOCA|nr:hypothetical protein [Nocardia tenerifensis]PXX71623.1 hypothetical protein DFR70_1011057 [Nocardia tenerifensis]